MSTAHNVNPTTDRCVICGRNAYRRERVPDCDPVAQPLAPPQAREESIPMFAAAIMTVLKEECEREHARAESLLAEKAAAERARDEARKERDEFKEAARTLGQQLERRAGGRDELTQRLEADVLRLTLQLEEASKAILPVQVHNFKAARELVATHSNRKNRSTLLDTMDNVLLKAEAADSTVSRLTAQCEDWERDFKLGESLRKGLTAQLQEAQKEIAIHKLAVPLEEELAAKIDDMLKYLAMEDGFSLAGIARLLMECQRRMAADWSDVGNERRHRKAAESQLTALREQAQLYIDQREMTLAGKRESDRQLTALRGAKDAAETSLAEARRELSEAASRINCAGPVANRIDVLRRELSDRIASLRGALEYLHFAVNEYLSYSPSRRDSKMGSSLDAAMLRADETIHQSVAALSAPIDPQTKDTP